MVDSSKLRRLEVPVNGTSEPVLRKTHSFRSRLIRIWKATAMNTIEKVNSYTDLESDRMNSAMNSMIEKVNTYTGLESDKMNSAMNKAMQ